jgi:hypothetical protein
MVRAFEENACLKAENSILLSSFSEICQVPCRYRQNRCIPLDLPNNPNYIFNRMHSYPYQNVTSTEPRSHISEVEHQRVTL